MMTDIDLSVIIVNYNTSHLLGEMFGALESAVGNLTAHRIVVDNASVDSSVEVLHSHFPDAELIANAKNVGFGRANNQGLPFVKGRYVLLLNTDAFVSPDALSKTVAHMEAHPRCGILGVKLVGRDGALQPSCRYFPTPWNLFLQRSGLARFFRGTRMVDDMGWDHASVRQCDWVPGCYYLIRRKVIDQVGLFDPRYFLYYEEVDHCFTAKKAGWEVHYFPDTTVVHLGGESAKSEGELTSSGRQLEALQIESELLYFRKNHGFLAALADALLITLADMFNATKRALKGRRPTGVAAHIALVWKLYFRTRMGSFPTR